MLISWKLYLLILEKISYVVNKKVVKKDLHNFEIKNIEDKIHDITKLATTAAINIKINKVKNKISSIPSLATNSYLNAKISEVKSEMLRINKLATAVALIAGENKIPRVSGLEKKQIMMQK